MTLTASCDEFVVDSTNIVNTNTAISLSISYQKGTPTVITPSTSATEITIEPDDLEMGTTFKDGVYSFTLTITKLDSTIVTETYCYFMECGDECKFTNSETNDLKSIEKSMAYLALKLSSSCDSCRCDELANLYTLLTSTNTCNACSCGCN